MSILHAAAAGPSAAKANFAMTPLMGIKFIAGIVFGGLTLYFLNTGKTQKSFERLLWAGVFGLLTILVCAL